MRARMLIVGLVLLAGLCFVVVLFAIQNAGRTVQLSLDLGVAAWQLAEPASVSAVVGGAFGLGFALALGLTLPRLSRLGRKVRALERQTALTGGGQEDPWR